MRIKAIIADDHPLIRNGLKIILQNDPQVELLAEAGNSLELLALLDHYEPDIVLLDIQMSKMNGLEAGRQIKARRPNIALLALTMNCEDYLIKEMLHIGAKGFLLKNVEPAELINAVKIVHGGGYYYSKEVSEKIGCLIADVAYHPFIKGKKLMFSETEVKIIELLCKGCTGKEISAFLRLAEKTIEHYKERIREKTGTKNSTEIAVYAVLHNIVNRNNLL